MIAASDTMSEIPNKQRQQLQTIMMRFFMIIYKTIKQSIIILKPTIPFSSIRLLVNDIQSSQNLAVLIVHGPGQFQGPNDLPGAPHLMLEHMILSYKIQKMDDSQKKNKLFDMIMMIIIMT